jgi:hypothetical protein
MYRIARQNKYGNRRHEYNGRVYHSKREAAYAQQLDLRLKAGEIASWEPQFKIDLKANGKHICTMIPDFRVVYPDGSVQLTEIKGYATEVFRLKVKILEATYLKENPGITYLVVR